MANAKLKELTQTLAQLADRKRFNKINFYHPYPKQRKFLDLGLTKRERLFCAGNRVGKSETGAFEAACHATGLYPAWWEGARFDHPTRGWCAGVTAVATRDIQQTKLFGTPGVIADIGTGYIPKDRIIDKSMTHGVTDAFDTVQVRHSTNGVDDGISTVGFKSFEQGRAKFQGDTIDWGWGDEEGPFEVYTEFLTRLTGQGRLWTTYTPFMGKTELTERFLSSEHPDRAMQKMSLLEAEHFTREEIQQKIDGYPSYERDARIYGDPKMGEGRVFMLDEALITENPLTYIPEHWVAIWGIDFGIGHPFAAILALWDKDNDCIHLHHAIRIADAVIAQHASMIKRIAANVNVAWPQDGTARDPKSGSPVAALYRQEGVRMLPTHATFVDGSVSFEGGITEMEQRMKSGRLKVAAHLSEWFEEFRFYHRKDGKVVKVHDDLMSATRMVIMAKRFATREPLGALQRNRRRRGGLAGGIDPSDHWGY